MKKFSCFFLIIIITISCRFGTLGGFSTIHFPTSKKKFDVAIEKLYQEYPTYKIPNQWKEYDTWSKRGYDFLESRLFYIDDFPKMMFYVTFIGENVSNEDPEVEIAIRAVNFGDHKWYLEKDFDNDAATKIEKRFHDEIIVKLEKYLNCKSEELD